jgi:recombination DNA repair RAD52 pathway protein
MAMHSGTLIDKRQETYLQSKKDIRWKAFKRKLKDFDDSVANVTNKIIWLNIFSEKMLLAAGDQDSGHFNNFIRYYSYKTLLFKSFWFSKLISTIIRCGKKLRF